MLRGLRRAVEQRSSARHEAVACYPLPLAWVRGCSSSSSSYTTTIMSYSAHTLRVKTQEGKG